MYTWEIILNISRTKPPDRVTKPVGNKARKQVKLGKILDEMYSDLQNEKLQSKCPSTFIIVYYDYYDYTDYSATLSAWS